MNFMDVTYFGHACFGIRINGVSLLLDPFISPNPKAESINLEEINPDYILITHGHGDHVTDVEEIQKRSKAQLISNFEIINWFSDKGIANGTAMNHGGTVDLGACKVKMVNAIHSSTLPDGSNGGNPAGFVIWDNPKSVYFAGDTALTLDMQLIKDEFEIDVAFLPIGDLFTMGVDDAVRAATFSGASRVIGMHYDTFPPIEIDHDRARQAFSNQNIELVLMQIGETLSI